MLKINKIYHLNCFEFLKKIDDKSIDLAVIDPPYFLNKDTWDTFKCQEDFLHFTFSWVDALIPKIKNSGSLYIFNTPLNCAFILPHILKKGLKFKN